MRRSASRVPSKTTGEACLDDRKFGANRSRRGAEILRSLSATHNDDSLLKKAVSGSNLDVADASIWRISVYLSWADIPALPKSNTEGCLKRADSFPPMGRPERKDSAQKQT